MKKKWIAVFALAAVVLAAVVVFREQKPKTQEFSPTGETLILDDGTKLELWQGNMGSVAYYMPGGIRLLEVRHTEGGGPENVHTANVDFTLADLPQAAQTAILDYYEALGALYDLDAVLKQELAFYREKGREFTAGVVDQRIYPSGREGNVVYFDTEVLTPIAADSEAPIPKGSRLLKDHTYRAGFDRETGALVETSDWEKS